MRSVKLQSDFEEDAAFSALGVWAAFRWAEPTGLWE